MNRSSGVLMHISSLYGEYGIGGFSKAAFDFVDFLSDCGFTYWQVLPFCLPDSYHSPYQSLSAFGGNPWLIDLQPLQEQGLISKEELQAQRQHTPYLCEFDRLQSERLPLLKAAAGRVGDRTAIEQFILSQPHLENCCKFLALREANGQKPWNQWTVVKPEPETLFAWQWVQYTFHTQWQTLKQYANQRGIQIIGDMPMYVSYDSSDVWGNQKQFLLDRAGRPSAVAGVPPDYFSNQGQLWGNPLYDWAYMAQDRYTWWHSRIEHALSMFDGLRLDHFRAFSSYWAVPYGAKSAKEGEWRPGPGRDLIDRMKIWTAGRLIIAEDLGDITPDVRALVEDSGFPGMRVFQFAFLEDEDNLHLPHNYDGNCVAYSGTHDNNTLLGYLWELDAKTRSRVLAYCGHGQKPWEEGLSSMLRTLFASSAKTVIFPIQDLLGFGADTRMNTPGRAAGNWQFRITQEQLESLDRSQLWTLNRRYFRTH